ncbi:MAG: peptidyl-prolyl cis-trans isomerase [Candidatus Omnitrophota bacterium]
MKYKTGRLLLFLCFISITFTGCDQITALLGRFFPSLDKKEPAKQETPVSFQKQDSAMTANTLARVGKWTITIEEFNARLDDLAEAIPELNTKSQEAKDLILEELIRQQLLIQEAERQGLDQQKDIKSAVEEFRRTLLVQEIVGKITEGIGATDGDVLAYYDQNKNAFADAGQWRLREILVPAQAEANEVLIELLKGADFATTARERSKSISAKDGGDLGYVEEFKFPQMANAVVPLDVGGISSVFKGPDGYYIVKLEDRKGGEPKGFEEVREDIQSGLQLLRQQQAVLDYIEQLKGKTTIETNENLLN